MEDEMKTGWLATVPNDDTNAMVIPTLQHVNETQDYCTQGTTFFEWRAGKRASTNLQLLLVCYKNDGEMFRGHIITINTMWIWDFKAEMKSQLNVWASYGEQSQAAKSLSAAEEGEANGNFICSGGLVVHEVVQLNKSFKWMIMN